MHRGAARDEDRAGIQRQRELAPFTDLHSRLRGRGLGKGRVDRTQRPLGSHCARPFRRAMLLGCPDRAWAERVRRFSDEVEIFDPGPMFAEAAGGLAVEEDMFDFGIEQFDLCIAIGTLDTVDNLPLALTLIHRAEAYLNTEQYDEALVDIEAILKDKRKILPCAAYLQGEYGYKGLFVGVPVKLGRNGMEEIIQIKLTAEEKAGLDKSAAAVQELALDDLDLLKMDIEGGEVHALMGAKKTPELIPMCHPLQ